MEQKNKRRTDIIILRTLSMMMIVLCHIIHYYTFIPGSQILGQVFNVGVQIFLLISGYLYGMKSTWDFSRWIVQRVRRICIPVFLVAVADILILSAFFSEKFTVPTVIAYLFDLQGLLFIDWNFFRSFFTEITNLGPLWFATIIMLCYLTIPILVRLRKRFGDSHAQYFVHFCVFTLLCVLKFVLHIDLFIFIAFYIGFFLASKINTEKKIPLPKFLFFSLAVFVMQVLRIFLMLTIDGSQIYFFYVTFSHLALGLFIFLLFIELQKYFPKLFHKIGNNKIITHLDRISFHIYLVHGIFCMGKTNIYNIIPNILLATFVYIVAVLGSAITLYYVEKFVNRCIDRVVSIAAPKKILE